MIRRRSTLWTVVILLAGALVGLDAYLRLNDAGAPSREAVLSLMPADASTVVFADLTELRRSPFVAELYNWIPENRIDADYAQFLGETGFDYERDLDRLAIAFIKAEKDSKLLAVAQGRFDRKKLESYAVRSGSRENRRGREIFSVPLDSGARKISFAFIDKDIIALTDSGEITALLPPVTNGADRRDWRERFDRVAGSPVFAVIRQDSEAGSALAARAPGGFQSPQLASLLNQLQWITLAGKPQEGAIRIVAEGECPSAQISQQLSDILNGMLALAQAGLNGPETRRGLNPRVRDAYLDLVKGAEISRLDRGETKSVRAVFDVTSNFLQAVSTTAPTAPTVIAPANPSTSKNGANKRSRKSVEN